MKCLWQGCDRPARSGRSWGRFCSSACRASAWNAAHPRQKTLDLTPQPMAIRPLSSGVPESDKTRLKPSAVAILARLQQGPATALDLARCGGGLRYGARLLELRQVGHAILAEDEGAGVWRYRLSP